MILPVHERLRERLSSAIGECFGLAPADLPAFAIAVPPSRRLGDLAIPAAFALARQLERAPRAIAESLAASLGPIEEVARIEVAANGYLNVFLDRSAFLRRRLEHEVESAETTAGVSKAIVEHTAINPNKAAHIGHLRNAVLGDTLGRMLRFRGVPVEIQNYIDDTGVQVADVVVGFRELAGRSLADVRELADSTRFDYYCWDLYAKVAEWYEADPSRLQHRTDTLHAIEAGGNPSADMGAFVANRIVRCHLATMARLGIDYDLLTWEGDILRLQFWATAFEQLKRDGAVFLQDHGRLAGCWVMRIDEDPDGDPAPDEGDAREKVIVRSNGTVTYVGKDIAYQFWKFGLLGRDFHYHRFGSRLHGADLWSTTSDEHDGVPATERPAFGAADAVFNVIDTRQAYLQKLLKQALAGMGYTAQAERSVHFAYEMVALSHATAREFGFDTDAYADRPFVEVSGRKGVGVKADDLVDRLIEKAAAEVIQRNPELDGAEREQIAEAVAVAALRYFMIKYSRSKVIAFDIDEALSFEGESGPYLQYAVVRAGNIFQKLRERTGTGEAEVLAALPATPADALNDEEHDELWDLVLEASRLDEVIDQAVRTLEPSVLAKHAFALAQRFSAFYHRYPVLNEPRLDARTWRAAATLYFRRQLVRALDVMGARVPARM